MGDVIKIKCWTGPQVKKAISSNQLLEWALTNSWPIFPCLWQCLFPTLLHLLQIVTWFKKPAINEVVEVWHLIVRTHLQSVVCTVSLWGRQASSLTTGRQISRKKLVELPALRKNLMSTYLQHAHKVPIHLLKCQKAIPHLAHQNN